MAKTQIKNYVFKPGIGANDNRYPNAYALLSANKEFIQKESTAWIAAQVAANVSGFVGYTYNEAKCQRDVGYIIDAYLTDLRYGGNETVINNIKYYWDQDVAQVDGDRQPEIQTHTWIGNLIKDNIFPQVAYSAANTEVTQDLSGTASETLQQFTPTNGTYKPQTGVMSLTIGTHTLSVGDEIFIAPGAVTFTCALDGNATLHPYPRASGVPNATGKDGFYYAPLEITAVTSTTITVNVGVSSDTSLHTFNTATANGVTAGPNAKINTLVFNTVDTITNGLGGLPKKIYLGVGNVKIQGKWQSNELLLITNTITNEIIYNFGSATQGGVVTIMDHGIDTDFLKFLETTDGVTTVKLNYSTTGQSATDDLQIFVEEREVRTRPFDFGTDAIERGRTAEPKSMLDADFEYGLQPTKWSAIGTLRGYPSVYEIPGTDTEVILVVTDASTGSEGVGQSLITVTTQGPHGFVAGDPITIKALENSITGAARAEGSFIINATPTTATFNFYAKAKVGTANGEILTTTYTQLRKAGFYTGANVGTANFTIQSNGSNGVMNAQLNIPTGATIIPFDGPAPEVGSPLTNGNIPVGSQVTGIIDTSAGGGTYITPAITETVNPGENRVYLDDVTGVLANLSADKGNGDAINISTVGANYIDFDGNFSSTLVPNKKTYTGVAASNVNPTGTSATFDITLDQNAERSYTVTVNTAGTGYANGDRITIDGLNAGGTTGTNNIIITITAVTAGGGVSTFSHTGVHWDGSLSITDTTATPQGGTGTGALLDVNWTAGNFSSVAIASSATDSGYAVGDVIKVLGSALGGLDETNDLSVSVVAVGGTGDITSLTYAGASPNVINNYGNVSQIGYVQLAITNITQAAPAVITVADTSQLTNGQFVTISDVVGMTEINAQGVYVNVINSTTFSIFTDPTLSTDYDSTAHSSYTSGGNATRAGGPNATYSGSTGEFASLTITNGNGFYAVGVDNGGQNYLPTETFTVTGDKLGGTTPANDATITFDNVSGTGEITVASITGTGSTDGEALAVSGSNRQGLGATFDVSIVSNNYVVALNNAGTLYNANQELKILGTFLGGATPANDLTITISAVDALTTGVITTINSAGTTATPGGTFTDVAGLNNVPVGSSATFTVAKNFAVYDTVSAANAGTGYAIGDRLTVAGNLVDGATPSNDIDVTVSTVGAGGEIETVTHTGTGAPGSNLDLISTILMSQASTAPIAVTEAISYSALATLEITFANAHGFVPGDSFITTVTSDDGSNNHALASGSFFATDIPDINKLRYTARAPGAIDASTEIISGIVYPRPDSFFIHRPYDGGVQLGTGGPQHGAQAIRQSKKYIRYQSGKGIMYTTGALFAPSYDLANVTADGVEVGSTITVTTDDNDHGVQVGGIVRLLGVKTPGYNSGSETAVPPNFDYEVVDVIDERSFQVRSQRRLGSTTAVLGFGAQMSVVSWHGATVRSGIFDDQNGIYWEYDGTNVQVCQRTSTKQISGTITMQTNNNEVIGVGTRFREQLKAGDRVVIKGMTHVITNVISETELSVSPDWRGVGTISGAKMNLVVDKKAKQKDFNLDTLDGNGPSGYDIDIAKMQMIGIQYSWYGAGFIDFMLRGSDGNFVFCHRMRNSNVNTEAFMRSGNLPVRYEVTNEGPPGKLASAMTIDQNTIVLEDASFFPDWGTVYIDNEVMSFDARSGNTLTGVVRAASLTNFQAGADRIYNGGVAATHAEATGVVLISNTVTPLISHWGSAFITDGGFDEDRGYIFSYAETGITVSTTRQTAFMLRLAPSVSNAIVGDLGERELLNRAQLLLQGLEITSDGIDPDNSNAPITGGVIVEGVLNPQNYPLNPGDVNWAGLSGVAQGGQPSFAQIASGGGISWNSGDTATYTTATVMSKATTTATLMPWWNFRTNRNYGYFTQASWELANLEVGDLISDGAGGGDYFPGGTAIQSIFDQTQYGRYLVYFTQRPNANSGNGVNQTFEKGGDSSNGSFAYFTESVWNATGAKAGTPLSDAGGNPTNQSDVSFPANVAVSSVEGPHLFGSGGGQISYYKVNFNSSYTGTVSPGDVFNFEFSQPPYAQPGETVFSFIAVPGERSTLSLAELKELTNTPLGGRGTFPNGPDVLAINIYKVSGGELKSNILLKWGEAQA
jgi:hypothetical protein